jgi:hypothetical protein
MFGRRWCSVLGQAYLVFNSEYGIGVLEVYWLPGKKERRKEYLEAILGLRVNKLPQTLNGNQK